LTACVAMLERISPSPGWSLSYSNVDIGCPFVVGSYEYYYIR
jgi:hypothetical protein